jgi:drug/metabolite transporter (DMT)-like permease
MQADDRALLAATVGITAVGAGVAAADHLTGYPVLTAQAARYGVAAVILLAIARGRHTPEPRLDLRAWARIAAVAASGMALFNIAVVRAVTTGEPAVVATVIGLAPIGFAVVVPALERRRPTVTVLAGATLAAVGAGIVEGLGQADLESLVWSAVALCCEVAFTVLAAPLLKTLSPLGLSVRACALAAVLLGVASLATDGTGAFPQPRLAELAAVAYLAVLATAVAFVLWYHAVDRLGAERAGLVSGVMPVSAALIGAAITPAPLRAGTLLGTVVVGAGLLVGLSGDPPRPSQTESR